jgi:hypothetical protein
LSVFHLNNFAVSLEVLTHAVGHGVWICPELIGQEFNVGREVGHLVKEVAKYEAFSSHGDNVESAICVWLDGTDISDAADVVQRIEVIGTYFTALTYRDHSKTLLLGGQTG